MAYRQAHELLKETNPSLSDLLDAIWEMGMEYGYIAAMSGQGLREDAETDLVRIIVLSKLLKAKIEEKS